MRLLERGDSLLAVVDAQPGFFAAGLETAGPDTGGLDVARHAKGLDYERVRTLEAGRAFEAADPHLAAPPGFALQSASGPSSPRGRTRITPHPILGAAAEHPGT